MIKKQTNSKKSNKNLVTKKQVKDMIRSNEVDLIKVTDTIVSLTTFNTTGFQPITLPATGTGFSSMNGSSIELDHFEVRITGTFNDSVASSNDCVVDRITIFQQVGETNITTSAQAYQQVTTARNVIDSPFNYNNHGRLFKVLLDRRYSLSTYEPTYVDSALMLKPKIRALRYDSVAATWPTGIPVVLISTAGSVSGGSTRNTQVLVRCYWRDV